MAAPRRRGYTGRANSVLPIGDPGVPLDDALTNVRSWYAARGLAPRFQLPLPLCADLDAALADRGWTPLPRVHVKVTDLGPLRMNVERVAPPPAIDGEHHPHRRRRLACRVPLWRRSIAAVGRTDPHGLRAPGVRHRARCRRTPRKPLDAARSPTVGSASQRSKSLNLFRRQGLGRLVIGALADVRGAASNSTRLPSGCERQRASSRALRTARLHAPPRLRVPGHAGRLATHRRVGSARARRSLRHPCRPRSARTEHHCGSARTCETPLPTLRVRRR